MTAKAAHAKPSPLNTTFVFDGMAAPMNTAKVYYDPEHCNVVVDEDEGSSDKLDIKIERLCYAHDSYDCRGFSKGW